MPLRARTLVGGCGSFFLTRFLTAWEWFILQNTAPFTTMHPLSKYFRVKHLTRVLGEGAPVSGSEALRAHYENGRFCISFELFPPKSDSGLADLRENVKTLLTFNPSFVTCTYGAGGSTRDRTLETLKEVRGLRPGLPVASHLTCVGLSREEIEAYLERCEAEGIDFIVALRGDPPKGEREFTPVANGFAYGNELVSFIRERFPKFGVAVAGYPETHLEAENAQADLENLKRKVEAGADVVITQLFYDNDDFFRFRDRYDAIGIDAPLVPGILPITSLKQIERLTSLCGATIPEQLRKRLIAQGGSAEGEMDVGVYHATKQVEGLVDGGVPGVHFYVLNKSAATTHLLRAIDLHAID